MKKSLIIIVLVWTSSVAQQPVSGRSEWVYPGSDGKLKYKTTPAGDRIIDFSHAGYMGGGVALPVVPVKRTLRPSGQDDSQLIQSAVNDIAAMPLINGFRGALQLEAGTFICSSTITIGTSGIVIRGSGPGTNGTTIKMTGNRHTAFVIGKNAAASGENDEKPAGTQSQSKASTKITDTYVPAGTRVFTVADATAFAEGDIIVFRKPVTASWVHLMQMDNLNRDGKPQTWIGTNRSLEMQRKIVAINGNKITIDVPLVDAVDSKYSDPPGATIVKLTGPQPVTQVGIEELHIQCPPLEIDYGHAPYSAIRIGGDDCWVKNIYCEETMNTTTITGNRVTMERVVVKHTYPNLGASKPADFSLEGSQVLLDRCESTGGNTYFVWTSSLVPGPNVMLNCTFWGHGSRIQPHHRWSTALLVDNCTIIDGGIDFMNRGVAGSGHGWTMAWAVAWNSIAKTYIIQNPPGTLNWAIGCIGRREQTARLFDSPPVLPDGVFDSHNKPVTPQSLYLAQLSERLGTKAMANIGYASNSVKEFTNKAAKPSPPLKKEADKLLGANIAAHRPVNANNMRGDTREFAPEKALDANDATYWATKDGVEGATIEIDMEGPAVINAIEIGEAAGLEQQVQSYKVEGQVNSDWKLLSEGTTIGKQKIDKFPAVTVWKVKVTILTVKGYAAIRKIGLYKK